MLNYYKNRAICVYLPEVRAEYISKFVDIKENIVVTIEGKLSVYGKQEVFLTFIANNIYLDKQKEEAAVWEPKKEKIKMVPPLFKIALISNENGDGKIDFITKLKDYSLDTRIVKNIVVPLIGEKALEAIPAAIQEANDDPNVNLICLVRGGGDKLGIRYVFDSKEVCEAILKSQKPVLVGVGHTSDITNADKASDAPLSKGERKYFKTPTELAEFLARDVHRKYCEKRREAEQRKVVEIQWQERRKAAEIQRQERRKAAEIQRQESKTAYVQAPRAVTQPGSVEVRKAEPEVESKKILPATSEPKVADNNKAQGFNFTYLICAIVGAALVYFFMK